MEITVIMCLLVDGSGFNDTTGPCSPVISCIAYVIFIAVSHPSLGHTLHIMYASGYLTMRRAKSSMAVPNSHPTLLINNMVVAKGHGKAHNNSHDRRLQYVGIDKARQDRMCKTYALDQTTSE